MSMDPYDLQECVEAYLKGQDVEGLEVSLCWPAHVVSDRESTEADGIEAQRLANEEWYIRIKPVKR